MFLMPRPVGGVIHFDLKCFFRYYIALAEINPTMIIKTINNFLKSEATSKMQDLKLINKELKNIKELYFGYNDLPFNFFFS